MDAVGRRRLPGRSTRAVGKWMAAYRASGEEGLKTRPRPGAKPKLLKRQEEGVLTWMAGSPRVFGYPDNLWTTRRLAEVIQKKYKVRFNSNYLAEWLPRRGYSPQKPEVRDEPAIARWAAEDWPRIKKTRDERAHVVLIDESGFFLNPKVCCTWSPRGATPVLTGFGRHRDKVSTIAAITVVPHRRRLGLYWRTDPETYIDAAAVVTFLRELLRRLRGRAIVV